MALLIRYQKNVEPSTLEALLKEREIKRWIYLGTDTGWRIRAERSIRTPRKSIANELDAVARKYRKDYINAIGILSQRNNSFEWWASDPASKNPYTHLFTRICLSEVVNHIDVNDACIITSSPSILRTISGSLSKQSPDVEFSEPRDISLRQLAYALPIVPIVGKISAEYSRYLNMRPEYRIKKFEETEIDKFDGNLFFTWVDERSSVGGKYVDPHFGPLPSKMRELGYDVAFTPRILPGTNFNRMVDKLIASGEKMYFPEMFIERENITKCIEIAKSYTPVIPPMMIGGTDIQDLVREQADLSRKWHVDSLLYRDVIQGMYDSGVVPSAIYYGCEGQSWENALVHSIRNIMPKTKIVAYDNTTFTKMACAMFPSDIEYNIRPFPDRIVTQGHMFANTLAKYGYPQPKIVTGCGLRSTYTSEIASRTNGNDTALIATSIDADESMELLSKVLGALGGSRYRVIVKAHPVLDMNIIMNSMGEMFSHDNVEVSTRPITDLLSESGVLFYAYTTICIDALRYGVVPVFVRNEHHINLDKIDSEKHIRFDVTTSEDVMNTMNSLSTLDKTEWRKEAMKEFYYAITRPDEDFIEKFIT